MKKNFHIRGFLIFLPLALLVLCAGCAPSSEPEGTALFRMDPESMEYVKLCDAKGNTLLELEGKEDIRKIVSVFNQFRYRETKEVPEAPQLREDKTSYPREYSVGFRNSRGKCFACEFAQCGEIRVHGKPLGNLMTVYISGQPGCFDEVLAYLSSAHKTEEE